MARTAYADADPLARRPERLPMEVGRSTLDGASYRRLLTLPPSVSRHRVAGARVHRGELQIRFDEGVT